MENKKRTISIIGIFTFILAIVGGTLAYWTWTSNTTQQTNVVFTVTSDFSCAADGGGNIASSDVSLAPTSCTDTSRAIKRKVTVTPTLNRNDLTISMDLWLDINDISLELTESEYLKYVLTTSDSSCAEGTIVTEGTFNGKSQGDKIDLFSGRKYTSTSIIPEEYYLYIWLDKDETNNNTMNKVFNLSLNGSCTDRPSTSSEPEAPVLDDGMIPVTIANDGTVTTVASTDSNWYNYENKQWANVVLVNQNATDGVEGSQSREYYLSNLSNNVEVNQSDILAYYVWIPRYSYAFPKADGNPEEISIIFESADTPKSKGTATGDSYYTHPAFTFGTDELNGIWVGKFETTPDKNSECYSWLDEEFCNNTTQNPTILPNEASLIFQQVSNQFTTSQNISKINNVYGLSNTLTDAHMMKNSEWGAVAYLSHSVYGINKEIRINNYWNEADIKTLTGCGAATDNAELSTTCSIVYGSGVSEYPQSTTGNISGVFDMSGGAWECVMGHYGDTIDTDNDYYSGFTTLPDNKYYDLYSIHSTTLCTLETCGGHALNETTNWYGDYEYFVVFDLPWFVRGGHARDGSGAGAFYSNGFEGLAGYGNSWRSVLAVG